MLRITATARPLGFLPSLSPHRDTLKVYIRTSVTFWVGFYTAMDMSKVAICLRRLGTQQEHSTRSGAMSLLIINQCRSIGGFVGF